MKLHKTKVCSKCGKRKPTKAFYKNSSREDGFSVWCTVCRKKYRESEENKAVAKEHRESEEGKAVAKKYAESERGKAVHKVADKKHYEKLKSEVFEAYGGRCEFCRTTYKEYLQIDHINGKVERHPGGRRVTGTSLYIFLRRLGFPKGEHRLLCSNCNTRRENCGDKRAIELGKIVQKERSGDNENKRRN